MPYNNTPIAPSAEVSGQVSLPLARVQKIISADPDRTHVSKNASFAIALATEMFIQHLATTTHNVVKAERKPRRNIQYRDVSSAISKTDNLEFLVDVVPKTTTFGAFKKKREAEGKGVGAKGLEKLDKEKKKGEENGEKAVAEPSGTNDKTANGDGTANAEEAKATAHLEEEKEQIVQEATEVAPAAEDKMDVDEERSEVQEEDDPAAMQIEMEMRGPRANGASPVAKPVASGFTAINGSR